MTKLRSLLHRFLARRSRLKAVQLRKDAMRLFRKEMKFADHLERNARMHSRKANRLNRGHKGKLLLGNHPEFIQITGVDTQPIRALLRPYEL